LISISQMNYMNNYKILNKISLLILSIIATLFGCNGTSESSKFESLTVDSVYIAPIIDLKDASVHYRESKFIIKKDNGAKIITYNNNEIVNEVTTSDIVYLGSGFMIPGGGITDGCVFRGKYIYCTQNFPPQLKRINLNQQNESFIYPINLSDGISLRFIDERDDQTIWIQLVDSKESKRLTIGYLNLNTRKLNIILDKFQPFSSVKAITRIFENRFWILPQFQNLILQYSFDGELYNKFTLPRLNEREYTERPKYASESINDFIFLSNEEKSIYLSDYYKDFFYDGDRIYILHYVFQRTNFKKSNPNYLLTVLNETQEILYNGFTNSYILGFDHPGVFFSYTKSGETAKIIKYPLGDFLNVAK